MAKRNIFGTILEIFMILNLTVHFVFYIVNIVNLGTILLDTSSVLFLLYFLAVMLFAATILFLLVIVVIPTKHTFRMAVQALIFFDVFREE